MLEEGAMMEQEKANAIGTILMSIERGVQV
jgi:hypothetical protein